MVGAILLPAIALAHPLGNFSVNHYAGIVISSDAISLDVVVDTAEIPTLGLLRDLDQNGDGTLSRRSRGRPGRVWTFAGGLALTVNGPSCPEPWWPGCFRSQALPTSPPSARLRITLLGQRPHTATVAFTDSVDVDRVGWREIVVRGNGVTISPAGLEQDVSTRLTLYPADLLTRPLTESAISVQAAPGGPTLTAPPVPDATPLTSSTAGVPVAPADGQATIGAGGGLAGLISFGDMSPLTIILGLLVAALVGAGHALSPGHGKTVMAAYLVGTAGRPAHALLFGLTVTVSHTIGVLGLALVVWLAADILPPERLYPILTVISGATVIIVGTALISDLVRKRRRHESEPTKHDHPHDHPHPHPHPHAHPHPHPDPSGSGRRRLVVLGAAGGLVPSTAALVLLLGAVAAGQPAYGIALALAFGAGMAAVLGGIGLALVQGRRWIGARGTSPIVGRWASGRLATLGPWALAVTVLVGGVVLTSQALVVSL
jgi:ABC-type nickel/cobalt efflux system permease component RcnA